MKNIKAGFNAIRMVHAALFNRAKSGWLKQMRIQGAVDGMQDKVHQVIIGLFLGHRYFVDIELIVNPARDGISILLPKKCPLSTYQLKRVYKNPCGSLEVQFEFKRKRVYRQERPLKPHQALLEHRWE